MAWTDSRYQYMYHPHEPGRGGHVRLNRRCFIRKEHECGKMFGASKSCFIACPTDDELEPLLQLMSEKLTKHGVEPIVAVKERAYGQDIFCTKICGKIIESRFCAVILDDVEQDGVNIPNPNVYYEYGLMTALRKHIVPLQKDDDELAFNIQSYDTIKYNARNMGSELERAIRDAIRLTEADPTPTADNHISDKTISRRLELSGFVHTEREWFLAWVVGDTLFKGFAGKDSTLFLGRGDSEEDLRSLHEDLDIVIHRTEKTAANLRVRHERLKEQLQREQESKARDRGYRPPWQMDTESELYQAESQLKVVGTIHLAVIVASGLNAEPLGRRLADIAAQYPRFKTTLSSGMQLEIGGVAIEFSSAV